MAITSNEQVEELRKALRGNREARTEYSIEQSGSGSKSTGDSNRNSELDPTNKSSKTGHSIQPVSGPGSAASKRDGQSDDSTQQLGSGTGSASSLDNRERQIRGRSGEDHSQGRSNGTDVSTGVSESKRGSKRVGNIQTDEEIPFREFPNSQAIESTKRLPTPGIGKAVKGGTKGDTKSQVSDKLKAITSAEGRGKTVETVAGAVGTLLKEGSTLSITESKAIEPSLKEALRDFAKYADEALWKREGLEQGKPVWTDLDEEELNLLVRYLLKSGQHSAFTAKIVRGTINSHDYVALYMMLAPRAFKSAQIIQRTRKPREKKNANSIRRYQ